MIEVYQTDFNPETGNCLQACFASLMEVSLVKVPNFNLYFTDKLRMLEGIENWLYPYKVSISVVRYTAKPDEFQFWRLPEAYYIVGGNSANETGKHSVIYYGKSMVLAHDPNPKGKGLKSFDNFWFLVKK